MRLVSFFLLLAFYLNNFVLAYMLLETMEFLFISLFSFVLPGAGADFSSVVLVTYVFISVSILCFVSLIRVFSVYGKNHFFVYY